MALAYSSRLSVRATPIERAALSAAAGLAEFVAWRIERRANSAAVSVAERQSRLHAQSSRDNAMTRAHSLGLLR